MAITFPLRMPSLSDGVVLRTVLEAPDLSLWELKITDDGVLQSVGGATGQVTTLKLNAPDRTVWQVTVSNDGILQTSVSSGDSTDFRKLSSPNGDVWNLVVDNDGVLKTKPTISDFLGINSMTMGGRSTVGVSMSSFTLQQQVQVHQGDLWMARVGLIPMRGDDADKWTAFLLSLNGREGTFFLGDPGRRRPRGTVQGSPVVDGALQTGKALTIRGLTASATGIFKRGDYFQIGSGVLQRLHKVLRDVDADVNGKATLDIWPRLRESPADGEVLEVMDTAGVFRLSENTVDWEIAQNLSYGFEFEAVEAK